MTTAVRTFSGHRLIELRRQRGMSRQQLANAAGRSWPTVQSYELGRAVPPVSVAATLASTLGCTIDDLLEEVVEDAA